MTRPHSSSLRAGRFSEAERIYLVTTTTLRRLPIFDDLHSARLVVRALMWSDSAERTVTWAYVLMPDHLHWLFALGAGFRLDEVVGSIKKYSTRRINRVSKQRGSVWQPGFHDHALTADEELRRVARYVVMNPVRSGLVRSVRDYSWWDARWI